MKAYLILIVILFFIQTGLSIDLDDRVPVEDILEKIENNTTIEYHDALIYGNFSEDLLDLPLCRIRPNDAGIGISTNGKQVNSTIRLINCSVDIALNLSNIVFNKELDFTNSTFNEDVSFTGTQFNQNVRFNEAHFKKNANFFGSNFGGIASFWGAQFDKRGDFYGSVFNGPCYFGNAKLKGYSNFININFKDNYAEFAGTNISGNVDFYHSRFGSKASFENARIGGNSNFNDVIFGGLAQFADSRFSGKGEFINTSFNGNANFKGSFFGKEVSFLESKFNKTTTVDFSGSQFVGYFFGWNSIRNAFKSDEATQLALIKNLKEHGLYSDADDCYFSYRYSYMSTLIDYLGWKSCGFGVRPLQTLYFAFGILFIFGLIFFKFDVVRDLSGIPKTPWDKLRDCFFFSALLFFTLHPPKNLDYMPNWRLAVLLEDILGWLVMALFIVTLGNVIIR